METLSQSRTQSWLSWFYRGLIILGFLGLLARIVDLQVIRGDYFRTLAEGNRVRRVPIVASRGDIIARGGEVIVGSTQIKKRVVFDPMEGYIKSLDLTDAEPEEIITEYMRVYSNGTAFSHVSGYVGSVGPDEVGKVNALCPENNVRKPYSLVGRTGLENKYECLLSGRDGEELVEVDSMGTRIRTLGRLDSQKGKDIKTTINYGLQVYISEILSGRKEFNRGDVPEEELISAVVVSDTKGEILALYSSPSYDSNAFVRSNSDTNLVASILNDPRRVMFNRAVGGVYHPGSVFKPVVTVAALMSGAIDTDYTFDDRGVITIDSNYGTFNYRNWYFTDYGGMEGEVDSVRAMARSTDTYYYKVGELTGMEALNDWTLKFGFGIQTEIDIPGEVPGLVPNPEWKWLSKGERWFLGNTYHYSIGQGDTVATPLQVNQSISAIATGELCKPYLMLDSQKSCTDLEIDDEVLSNVLDGMYEACSIGGTGFTFFDVNDLNNSRFLDKRVACKTGTAETGVGTPPHAWFVFFTPLSENRVLLTETKEIVVTVLVEKGGGGSSIAGPIARAIYDYWFGFTNIKNDSKIIIPDAVE